MLHILGGFIFHFQTICREGAQETHRQAGDPGDQKSELDAKRTAFQKFNMERRKHHPLQEGLQSGSQGQQGFLLLERDSYSLQIIPGRGTGRRYNH